MPDSPVGLLGTLIERLHALSDHYLVESKRKAGGQQTRVKSKREIFEQFAYELRELESLALPPAPPQGQEPDDEPLHTGDDDRLDCLTSIRAGIEELQSDEDFPPNNQQDETLTGLLEDCDKLDALIIETIKRERLAASPPAQAQEPHSDESRSPDGDGPSMQRNFANASALGVAQRGEQRGGIPQDAHEHRAAEIAGSEPADSHTITSGPNDKLFALPPAHGWQPQEQEQETKRKI